LPTRCGKGCLWRPPVDVDDQMPRAGAPTNAGMADADELPRYGGTKYSSTAGT
jgi:hypothetical protein